MDTQPPRVLELIRPFDPASQEAEEEYDAVVRRVRRLRLRRAEVARALAELERQFVDGDFVVRSGPRRGQPLTRNGRRRRLARLLELGSEFRRLNDQERAAVSVLDSMNRALDRWARETWGA